ncbi:MAG: nicotinate (nicotinamide) nucleotide adenylyltransferase [Deltaproteobacteria bacterium]|nr:nicotinate (nicotinamide) nucleotide adenylyltransferase [Deltaproteobacteria bacterium]
MTENKPQTIALLGGSFNPVHYGHLRLAVEVYEALTPDRLYFIPSANPPHKPGLGMLPFELRVEILHAALQGYPEFQVDTLEADRPGPSYTSDTLAEYRRRHPNGDLYFILGSEDFLGLDSWKNWKHMPDLANLLVVPRQGTEEAEFEEQALRLWPTAEVMPSALKDDKKINLPAKAKSIYRVSEAGCLLYLPLPRLDINASLLRRRWLEGRRIDFWTPPVVVDTLEKHRELVERHWK